MMFEEWEEVKDLIEIKIQGSHFIVTLTFGVQSNDIAVGAIKQIKLALTMTFGT